MSGILQISTSMHGRFSLFNSLKSELSSCTLLITGGTGSFGNAVLDRFLASDIGEIRIFSRDEKKQDDMRHLYQHTHPELSDKLKFYIGDVRDLSSLRDVMHGVHFPRRSAKAGTKLRVFPDGSG